MKDLWLHLCFFFLSLSMAHVYAQAGYSVRESDSSLELKTPFGEKVVPDIAGPDGQQSYKIVIPLKDLKPEEPPKEEPPKPDPVAKGDEKKWDEQKPGDADDEDDEEEEVVESQVTKPTEGKKNEPVAPPPPAKNLVEIDDTDQLILEANYLYNHRRYFEASTVVERILRKKPTLVRAWIMKGSLLFVQGEKQLAKKAWLQAKSIDPSDPEVKVLLERYE